MSDTDTSTYIDRRAGDYPAEARFTRADGTIMQPAPDGCWMTDNGVHHSPILNLADIKAPEPEGPKTDEQVLREARELIDSQADQITSLKGSVEMLERQRSYAQAQAQEARAHVERIRDKIIEEAKERGWCDEVNSFLRSVDLDEWETEYEVEFTFTVTVTVAGCDDDDTVRQQAIDMVIEDPHMYLEISDVSEA